MTSSRESGGKSLSDRISNLPDELISHIISFLPTRCAVSTSILSTRWRYLWLFTPTNCLSFDDSPCFAIQRGCETIIMARKRRFREFVYKILQLQEMSPLKKFSLVCQGTYDISDLTAWVSKAVQRGVQELHYEAKETHDVLSDGVLVCETLARLELRSYMYKEINIPLSVSLPSLKILHLDHLTFFNHSSIQRLFSNSKLLEELTLDSCGSHRISGHVIFSTQLLKVLSIKNCWFNAEQDFNWNSEQGLFQIDAPNLAYLIYNCNVGVKIVPSWKNSCSLVEAELNFKWNAQASPNSSRYCSLKYYREIFKNAAYKTTKLYFSSDLDEFLPKLVNQEPMPEFHSLSKLHLSGFAYDSWKYVTNLLDKSPQLETLIIFEKGLVSCCRNPVLPASESLLPFLCNAKVIEVHNFCGEESSLLLLGHLLRNARFLKKLIVAKRVRQWYYCFDEMKNEVEINKDVMNLPRASSDCCIELK